MLYLLSESFLDAVKCLIINFNINLYSLDFIINNLVQCLYLSSKVVSVNLQLNDNLGELIHKLVGAKLVERLIERVL